MAAKQSPEQQGIVGRVMHEWKTGKLRSGSGDKVRNPKQAIAIALHEAGQSNQDTPAQQRRALKRTRAGQTRADLYETAKKQGVPGRSRMTKAQLQAALKR